MSGQSGANGHSAGAHGQHATDGLPGVRAEDIDLTLGSVDQIISFRSKQRSGQSGSGTRVSIGLLARGGDGANGGNGGNGAKGYTGTQGQDATQHCPGTNGGPGGPGGNAGNAGNGGNGGDGGNITVNW